MRSARGFVWLFLLAASLCLAAAISPRAALAQAAGADAPLFAGARHVRLYHCSCGVVAEHMLAENRGWMRSIALTAREIAALRAAVHYGPNPGGEVIVASGCYSPLPYGFLFFDHSRRLIGVVAVNFRHEDVEIVPASPPSPDRATVVADTRALWRIVAAHRAQVRQLGC
jgi:hypothetical protein